MFLYVCVRARGCVYVCVFVRACVGSRTLWNVCVCVCIVLLAQYTMRMRRVLLLSEASLAPPHFFTLAHKRNDFRKKKSYCI
jgi:hypothetical protein